jgi:hypothetical protein
VAIHTITVVGAPRPYPETERGWKLYQFLQLFPKHVRSRWVDSDTVETCAPFETDVLIVFVPKRPTTQQLSKIRYKFLFLAHYTDGETVDETVLAEFGDLATGYLLPAVNKRNVYPLPVLPMPLAFHSRTRKPYSYLDLDLKWRYWRASFVGAATVYQGEYPQRKEWVEALVRLAPKRVRVGLFDNESYPLDAVFPDAPERFTHPFLGPGFYITLMQLSQVCVAPAGNARWTYRHYEAIQAGNVLVSTDLREMDMLIPFPDEGIVYVPDHADVWPILAPVLDTVGMYQDAVRRNQAQMAQYLNDGTYSANKPLPLFDFLRQLEHVASLKYL